MNTSTIVSDGKPRCGMQSRLVCLFSGLPLILIGILYCSPGIVGGSPAPHSFLPFLSGQTDERKLPPARMQKLLKHYLETNGSLPIGKSEVAYTLTESTFTGPLAADDRGQANDMAWVADWSPAPLRSARVMCDAQTGSVLLYSSNAPVLGDPESSGEWQGKSAVATPAQAIAKAREYLRHFCKPEWCASDVLIREDSSLPQILPAGAWMLTVRRQGHVIHMSIDHRKGDLLFFAEIVERKPQSPAQQYAKE